ncbi:MAG: hypothetical protein LJE83_14495 [Gammaproteobacteria bacterium]|nr:hypothetical protein [Gammaproteobacteria bacterium]
MPNNLFGQIPVYDHDSMAVKKLLKTHPKLVHSENMKVVSHVQRDTDDWILNTLMIEGYDVPFKYRRKRLYKSINGQRVNLTYYPDTESVAGIEMEIMKVVRIKIA